MLKLFGTLQKRSSKLGCKISWSTLNHRIVCPCSSLAAASQIEEKKTELHDKKRDDTQAEATNTRINSVFQRLQGKSPKLATELLESVNKKDINIDCANEIIKQLHQMVKNNSLLPEDFINDSRYKKLLEIVSQQENVVRSQFNDANEYINMDKIPINRVIRNLSNLVTKNERNKPLLQSIVHNIARRNSTLNIKNIADILYGLASLNFPNKLLFDELSSNLQTKLTSVKQSLIIGSITKSFGMLRYRNEEFLDMITRWMVENKDNVRPHDLCAFVMTLAIVGYIPENSDTFFNESVHTLKETDMIKPLEWLNLVWALTVLDRVTAEQVDSVLNSRFFDKNIDSEMKIFHKTNKFLNINAAAQTLLPNYGGSLLSTKFQKYVGPVVREKDKKVFVGAITDALANLFPSRDYFRSNVNIDTGFPLDVEFFINTKGTPLLVNKINDTSDVMRIAVVANTYFDYCLESNHLLGPVLLHLRLLKAKGYKIMEISHMDFHVHDKLLNRITYLNDHIKQIVK